MIPFSKKLYRDAAITRAAELRKLGVITPSVGQLDNLRTYAKKPKSEEHKRKIRESNLATAARKKFQAY